MSICSGLLEFLYELKFKVPICKPTVLNFPSYLLPWTPNVPYVLLGSHVHTPCHAGWCGPGGLVCPAHRVSAVRGRYGSYSTVPQYISVITRMPGYNSKVAWPASPSQGDFSQNDTQIRRGLQPKWSQQSAFNSQTSIRLKFLCKGQVAWWGRSPANSSSL
jgi:hypothetical protein